jgi:metal-dependent hydrolase (beta-lactamase superfamily II)
MRNFFKTTLHSRSNRNQVMSIQKTPEANTIFFTWFNQYAGILLKTPSKTILIDPVDIKVKKLPTVDAILITHEHYDHLDTPLSHSNSESHRTASSSPTQHQRKNFRHVSSQSINSKKSSQAKKPKSTKSP